jgi:hypothetical protein
VVAIACWRFGVGFRSDGRLVAWYFWETSLQWEVGMAGKLCCCCIFACSCCSFEFGWKTWIQQICVWVLFCHLKYFWVWIWEVISMWIWIVWNSYPTLSFAIPNVRNSKFWFDSILDFCLKLFNLINFWPGWGLFG